VAKHAESLDRTHRLVLPVTEAEHAYARKAAGEAGFAGKAREALRAAGLLPPLVDSKARKGGK